MLWRAFSLCGMKCRLRRLYSPFAIRHFKKIVEEEEGAGFDNTHLATERPRSCAGASLSCFSSNQKFESALDLHLICTEYKSHNASHW